ncbi:MAG: hypothetical protein BGO31_18370 [Bacteroidetes bacterium 43-16]|nr:MAG: hypothetical protein BGO31_18370 [Bacteroidetes bacterium 43-16]
MNRKLYLILCIILSVLLTKQVSAQKAAIANTNMISVNADNFREGFLKSNHTYVIKTPVNLKSNTVRLPQNVTLKFEPGGYLLNGTVVGNNTGIVAPDRLIFKRNITISGTWNIAKATSDWFDCAKNGYSIDYKTFLAYDFNGTKDFGYKYNGKLYRAGTSPNVNWTDDTYPLNQLLNLKAKHTVITKGIYMVRPIENTLNEQTFTMQDYALRLRNADNCTLEINGTLKMIVATQSTYYLLIIYNSKNFTLTGTGKLEGDIYEHAGTTGEWGFLFHGAGLVDFKHSNLTYEGAWGDGVFISYGRIKMSTAESYNYNHHHKNLTINLCRRNGLVYELGDNVVIENCQFDGHKSRRGTPTYAGIDIEPFWKGAVPIFNCKNINVKNSTFKNYMFGPAVRYERVMGGTIEGNTFSWNAHDISVGQCYPEFEKNPLQTAVTPKRDFIEIFNNRSDSSAYFLVTSDLNPNKVKAYNNKIYDCSGYIFSQGNFMLFEFYNNTIVNAPELGITLTGDVIKMNNNSFKNVIKFFGMDKKTFINSNYKFDKSKVAPKVFEFKNNKVL